MTPPALPAAIIRHMRRPPSPPQPGRPKSRRLVARISVRLRREGGSLSITIPRYVARHWKLEPGQRLVVRSTDEGILLYPRYFLPYVDALAERGETPSTPRREPTLKRAPTTSPR